MQFRFRKYNEEKKNYDLITYTDIDDYDVMFKTLTFMKENECTYPIEVNTNSIVESLGDSYYVTNVSLCVSKDTSEEERLTPHFVVDVEEDG